MEIISRYRNQYNLTFLLNVDFNGNVHNSSHKYTDQPFLTLGFVPKTFGNKNGTHQGYSVGGTDVEFTNCDTNPSNSIKFYVKPLLHETSSFCCGSSVKSAWYDNANTHVVPSSRYLPSDFSFKFMVMMGGCGAFWTYEKFPMGVALGLKFSV